MCEAPWDFQAALPSGEILLRLQNNSARGGGAFVVPRFSRSPPALISGSQRSQVAPGQTSLKQLDFSIFSTAKISVAHSSHHPQGQMGKFCDLMKGNREEKKPSKMKSDPDLWLQPALPAQSLQPLLACSVLPWDAHSLQQGCTFEVIMKGIMHSGILRTGRVFCPENI